jgi:hypothetical protein
MAKKQSQFYTEWVSNSEATKDISTQAILNAYKILIKDIADNK